MNGSIKGMLGALGAVAVAMIGASANAQTTAPVAEQTGAYQIVKATDNRVWRLNVNTGELSVCTLEGENLLCTTSSKAVTPPTRSYEEYDAERARAEQEQRMRDMEFFDRLLAAARMVFIAGQESSASQAGKGATDADKGTNTAK